MGKSCIASDKDWEKKWQIEADFDAVCRAKAVEKDPARMDAVRKFAKEKLADNKNQLAATQAKIDLGEGKNP